MRISQLLVMLAALIQAGMSPVHADGRPGTVAWSDGKSESGALSLTPGKELRLLNPAGETTVRLEDIREIRLVPEKEEMWEGFYFPEPGQTTQKKTGEVYPIRYLKAEIAMADGKTLEGHLLTTVVYLETDAGTEKVLLISKQTGADGTKLGDLVYPTLIQFTGENNGGGSSQIDLTRSGIAAIQQVAAFAKPQLTPVTTDPATGKEGVWSVPFGDPARLFISVRAGDGFHVSWPAGDDAAAGKAVEDYLKLMEDFYDTRTLLGCFTESDSGDTYSLVMMSRVAKSVDAGVPHPYSLVLLRWKFDPSSKTATLLDRVPIVVDRVQGNSGPPAVFKEAALFHAITTTATPPHP